MKTYNINIQGYFLDEGRASFPSTSGLYFVYRGKVDKEQHIAYLSELIYIGDTSNLQNLPNGELNGNDFMKVCKHEEVLLYSYAEVTFPVGERKSLLNAMISVIMPSLNSISPRKSIGEEVLKIVVEGPHAFIPSVMTITS